MTTHDPAHAFVPYPPASVPNAASGPLAGLTLAVKDIYDVAGYPTGCGNPLRLAMSGVKPAHAPIVSRFLDAGARFVGKTHTDELAFSLNGKNAHFGTPVNGGAPDRIPGGSSSGSASAVSNGLADIALGSDTGGSVRGPASYCGLFGIRPTHGRVDISGCMPLSPSFDTVGLFARDAATFERACAVLLGEDERPLPATLRQCAAMDAFLQLDAPVLEALHPTAERVKAVLGPVHKVDVAGEVGFDALYWAMRRLQGVEAWAEHGAFIEAHAPPLGPGVGNRFAFSATITPEVAAAETRVREAFRASLEALLGADGVLVLPTMPDVAPRLTTPEDELDAFRNKAIRLLCLAGLSGLPQVTMPLVTRDGAPLGLSLLGPRGSDRALVALAARIAG